MDVDTQGVGTINENAEQSEEFCATNDLVLGGTVFKHKNIIKSPGSHLIKGTGIYLNQIYIHDSKRVLYRRSFLYTRVIRGADMGSDYHLGMAKLRLRLTGIEPLGLGGEHITTLSKG